MSVTSRITQEEAKVEIADILKRNPEPIHIGALVRLFRDRLGLSEPELGFGVKPLDEFQPIASIITSLIREGKAELCVGNPYQHFLEFYIRAPK